ncbi:MAG: phosphatidate cytidylyltransferase [Rhodothermales bacterium]
MSNNLKRILTAIVGIPLVLGALYAGEEALWVVVAVIALGAQWEFLTLLEHREWPVDRFWALLAAVGVLSRSWFPDWGLAVTGVGMLYVAWLLRKGVEGRPLERMAGTLVSLVYPVFLLSFILDIRAGGSFALVLLLFGMIWACDTAAYYTGRSLGRHKLAPTISPNKTWEGAVGGVLGALLVAFLVRHFWLPGLTPVDAMGLALIAGVFGQAGDLLESALKRSAGVKDSGTLLPGHGGMLDRFDSIIVAMPLYAAWLVHVTGLLV